MKFKHTSDAAKKLDYLIYSCSFVLFFDTLLKTDFASFILTLK